MESRHGSNRNIRTDSGKQTTQSSHQPNMWAIQHRHTENGSTQTYLGSQQSLYTNSMNEAPTSRQTIFQTANTHQDVHNLRDQYPLITTHRHPKPRRSHLPSLQRRQNLLDRYQQDRSREDSINQRNRGSVAQGNGSSTTDKEQIQGLRDTVPVVQSDE